MKESVIKLLAIESFIGSSGKWIGLLQKKRHDFILCGKN